MDRTRISWRSSQPREHPGSVCQLGSGLEHSAARVPTRRLQLLTETMLTTIFVPSASPPKHSTLGQFDFEPLWLGCTNVRKGGTATDILVNPNAMKQLHAVGASS